MDSASRHWYLQQMGIPVWVPKGSEAPVATAELAAKPAPESKAVPTEAAPPQVLAKTNTESPAKALAASLRAQQAVDNVASDDAVFCWLVMPQVADAQKDAAEVLINKVLAAAGLDATQCLKLWAIPNQLPPPQIRHLWCFGIEPPPNLTAQCLVLPSVAEMLENVEAKRVAWTTLKAAMPFN